MIKELVSDHQMNINHLLGGKKERIGRGTRKYKMGVDYAWVKMFSPVKGM